MRAAALFITKQKEARRFTAGPRREVFLVFLSREVRLRRDAIEPESLIAGRRRVGECHGRCRQVELADVVPRFHIAG